MAKVAPMREGREMWLRMVWRAASREGPMEIRDSAWISLELNSWKEFRSSSSSLKREESLPRGSFFFLAQSVGVWGAENSKDSNKNLIVFLKQRADNNRQLSSESMWEAELWFPNYILYINGFKSWFNNLNMFLMHDFIWFLFFLFIFLAGRTLLLRF